MRISGFSSGMDIDSMVKEMMTARRIPVNVLGQKKQVLEWQRESYQELNLKISNFRNNKLFNYNKTSTFAQVKSSLSGDTNAVTAKALGNAVAGTMTIKVIDLAQSGSNTGGDIRKAGQSIDITKTLMDQKANFSATGETAITSAPMSFKINGKEINVDPTTMSMNDVIGAINSQTDVQAVYDEGTGRVLLSTKNTGASAKVVITNDTKGFMTNVFKADPLGKDGKDAKLELNGVVTTRSSNSFAINGVDIKLNAVSTTATTISTSKDLDKIVDDIKGFINEYNDLIKLLNDKTRETRYRDYQPLTDDQRKDMKESEITQWEAKAKSGLLARDGILTKALSDMRFSIAGEVSTTGNTSIKQLAALGIETGSYTELGKLNLKSEDKLREALTTNPDAVIALFTSNPPPTVVNGVEVPPEHKKVGIFQRLYNDLKGALDGIKEKAGTSAYSTSIKENLNPDSIMGKAIKALTDKIRTQNENLKMLETRYYRQFTAMEVAMNKFNSQSSSLSGMLQ